jgi:hypothetical protein
MKTTFRLLLCLALAAIVSAGCGGVAEDPWMHTGKCFVQNESPEGVADIYLYDLEPVAWETKHLDALAPGESREIALPDNRIPTTMAVNWEEAANPGADIDARIDLEKSVGKTYHGDLRFVIRKKTATVEKGSPPNPPAK